jgi:hypothetical protein
MKIIKLVKLVEVDNAIHPNNIPVDYERYGLYVGHPVIGERFCIGYFFSTSTVTEIIDETTFKTLNSIYNIIEMPTLDEMLDNFVENPEGEMIVSSVVRLEHGDRGIFRIKAFYSDRGVPSAIINNKEFIADELMYRKFVMPLDSLTLLKYAEPENIS